VAVAFLAPPFFAAPFLTARFDVLLVFRAAADFFFLAPALFTPALFAPAFLAPALFAPVFVAPAFLALACFALVFFALGRFAAAVRALVALRARVCACWPRARALAVDGSSGCARETTLEMVDVMPLVTAPMPPATELSAPPTVAAARANGVTGSGLGSGSDSSMSSISSSSSIKLSMGSSLG